MLLIFSTLLGGPVWASSTYYATDYILSAPEAGTAGSTAIHMSSNVIVAWAAGYTNLQYGTAVDAEFKTPELVLGPALGTTHDIVCLGRGGQITLTFTDGIGDGPGADFAVFENSFDDYFLELAHVEVSSDGIHFVRFPGYSTTPDPVGGFGGLYTGWIHNLASKYRKEYGTPFDLGELQLAYDAQLAGNTDFSSAFASSLTNNFPHLDLNHITHLRLIDIVGDGSAFDARGSVIYDPYPTISSAGFDLDAVGVLNERVLQSLTQWVAIHSVPADGLSDSDSDGVIDVQEFVMGGDPNDPFDAPVPQLSAGSGQAILSYTTDPAVAATCWIQHSADLVTWTNAVPAQTSEQEQGGLLLIEADFSVDEPHHFFRLLFNTQ